MFVRAAVGHWILVEITADGIDIPYELDRLRNHLAEVQARADQLLNRLKCHLKSIPTEVSISEHYSNADSFSSRSGVTSENNWESGIDRYLLVTGSCSHFILPDPRVSNCPRHFWQNCDPVVDGRHPQKGALSHPSHRDPRAFFSNGTTHHCAASVTHGIKTMKYEELRIADFGFRSSGNGDPFCEIFGFEQMLCCQTCVYFEVCSKSKLFKLPCNENQERTNRDHQNRH